MKMIKKKMSIRNDVYSLDELACIVTQVIMEYGERTASILITPEHIMFDCYYEDFYVLRKGVWRMPDFREMFSQAWCDIKWIFEKIFRIIRRNKI